jgi:hypothetical protein
MHIYLPFAMTAEDRRKKIAELIEQGAKRGCLGLTFHGEREYQHLDPKWQYDTDTTAPQIGTLIDNLDKRIERTYRHRGGEVYRGATVTVFDHPLATARYG